MIFGWKGRIKEKGRVRHATRKPGFGNWKFGSFFISLLGGRGHLFVTYVTLFQECSCISQVLSQFSAYEQSWARISTLSHFGTRSSAYTDPQHNIPTMSANCTRGLKCSPPLSISSPSLPSIANVSSVSQREGERVEEIAAAEAQS